MYSLSPFARLDTCHILTYLAIIRDHDVGRILPFFWGLRCFCACMRVCTYDKVRTFKIPGMQSHISNGMIESVFKSLWNVDYLLGIACASDIKKGLSLRRVLYRIAHR
jgi:hypothetical protein